MRRPLAVGSALVEALAQVVCDPRPAGAADAIVVECGNARLQPTLEERHPGEVLVPLPG